MSSDKPLAFVSQQQFGEKKIPFLIASEENCVWKLFAHTLYTKDSFRVAKSNYILTHMNEKMMIQLLSDYFWICFRHEIAIHIKELQDGTMTRMVEAVPTVHKRSLGSLLTNQSTDEIVKILNGSYVFVSNDVDAFQLMTDTYESDSVKTIDDVEKVKYRDQVYLDTFDKVLAHHGIHGKLHKSGKFHESDESRTKVGINLYELLKARLE
jgi:hypothetical protein